MKEKENIYLTQHIIRDCDFEVIQLARKLAEIDDDFNGKNGDEYLWECSKKGGFSSNLEYAIAEISKEHDGVIQIKQFVDIWTSNNSQYTAHKVEIERLNGRLFVSVALIVGE